MANKKTLSETINKFESGKLLSKADCKVITDRIYTDFVASGKVRADLFDVLISNAEKVRAKIDRPFSVGEAKEYYGFSFCSDHTAKMAGMESASTNNKINQRCNKNKCVPGSICSACFADRQIDTFPTMDRPLTLNYLLLNYKVLPLSILPVINRQFFRVEAFGDVATAIQAINYINLCTANPINKKCDFGAWSKNPDIWYIAFEMHGKPKNLSFGVSSLFVNKVSKIPAKYEKYIDFVFTVFESEEEAEKQGYKVNCGARHCLSCLRCYNARKVKAKTGKPEQVIELKK